MVTHDAGGDRSAGAPPGDPSSRRGRDDPGDRVERVASTLHRAAVLLSAGVAPGSVWSHLAAVDPTLEPLLRAARAERSGDDPSAALLPDASRPPCRSGSPPRAAPETSRGLSAGARPPEPDRRPSSVRSRSGAPASRRRVRTGDAAEAEAWCAFAACWRVAVISGAPLGPALRSTASALRDAARLRRDVDSALAGPRATARLVMLMPLIGLLLSAALGVDALRVLTATGPGLVCLIGGGALLLAGAAWNRRLVARGLARSAVPSLSIDLVAVAVRGGGAIEDALRLVEGILGELGLSAQDAGGGAGGRVAEVVVLSRRAGVPAAELLTAEAQAARERARSEGERTAARLAISLLAPLGVCVLPAFLVLTVAPMMLAILSSTDLGFVP